MVALLGLASLAPDTVRYGALSLAAVTWLVPELAGWVHGSEQLRTAADAWARMLPAVVLVGVTSARGRSTVSRVLARTAIAGCTAAALARLLLVDPFQQVDCWRTCSANPLLVGDGSWGWLEPVAVLVGAVGLIGCAAVQERRTARLSRNVAAGVLLLGLAGHPASSACSSGNRPPRRPSWRSSCSYRSPWWSWPSSRHETGGPSGGSAAGWRASPAH